MMNWSVYSMNILLGGLSAKVVRESIFGPNWEGSLHEVCNNKDIRVITFVTSEKSHCQQYSILHHGILTALSAFPGKNMQSVWSCFNR
jgi:hypothetical protein